MKNVLLSSALLRAVCGTSYSDGYNVSVAQGMSKKQYASMMKKRKNRKGKKRK